MKDVRRILACVGAAILMCLIVSSAAYAGRTITVAVGGDIPTMKMKDSSGALTGFEIDMVKAIASEAGFQVKFVEVPWKNLYNDLNAGKYDAVVASVSITSGKKNRFGISEPYFSTGQVLVVPKSKANLSMNGRNIGVFKLSQTADKVRRSGANLTYFTAQETEQAFRDLAKGNVDGVLCDAPVALGYVSGKYSGKFCLSSDSCILDPSLKKEDYGIVCKKGNSEVLGMINKGLAAVKSKDTDDKIMAKWFRDTMVATASGQSSGSMFASEIPTGAQNSPVSPK